MKGGRVTADDFGRNKEGSRTAAVSPSNMTIKKAKIVDLRSK